jgi:phosphocarrier protein FPr/phosphocarrier protein
VAILARSMGVPAICAIDERALALPDGTRVVVDGTNGILKEVVDEASLTQAKAGMLRQAAKREEDRAAAFSQAQTRDGHRVEVAANISNLEDARAAVAGGAEGVGLLRSEFMFFDRAQPPDEDEQAEAYLAMAEVLGKNRPFVVRTLDVGGDKPLAYLPLPKEANPFLGMRGVRVSLDRPELFRAQLRAILRAAKVGNVHIMFPMISGPDELRAARRILAEEQGASAHVEVGVMIEVPSAVVMAEQLAREVDFFSIGTNDLTQYTLAMDRGHPMLARRADALHPAVLRMIGMTVEGAHKHRKWVGVCGGIASDPLAVPVLVGLGVDELSVSVPAIASIKATLARWTLSECEALVAEVMKLSTAGEVRALLTARQVTSPASVKRATGPAAGIAVGG